MKKIAMLLLLVFATLSTPVNAKDAPVKDPLFQPRLEHAMGIKEELAVIKKVAVSFLEGVGNGMIAAGNYIADLFN